MTCADDPFESPKGLVTHAREHADHLESEIGAFFDKRPYTRVIDYDSDTRQDVHKIRLTAKLPGKLSRILKDCTSNLRDALDHAVYAAAVSLGVKHPKNTGFPFANDATHLDGELARWIFADVPPEIRSCLRGFKPYPGGNDILVALNRIRNPNTHRVIVPVGTANTGGSVSLQHGIVSEVVMGFSNWDASKNEIEYLRVGRNSQLQYQVQVTFDVTFGDIEIVGGQPVTGVLRKMASEVERVILGLEVETARLEAAKAL
jgi:hypothetical protein